MSIKAMTWAMEEAPVDQAGPAHVLLILADHAWDDGRGSFPSVETIVWKTRMGERTVQRHLRTLEKDGLIRKGDQSLAAHYIEREDKRPTVYDLDLTRTRGPRPERGANLTPRESAEGSDGVPICPERGANLAPEPSLQTVQVKENPPTPQRDATEVADAPVSASGVEGDLTLLQAEEQDAGYRDEYLAAVDALCEQVDWNPAHKTRQQLTSKLPVLVPDRSQLDEVVARASMWPVPQKKSVQQLLSRVNSIRKQIDTGVPAIRSRGVQRSEVSTTGHEAVSEQLSWGW